MSYTGATGLYEFDEEIQNVSNYAYSLAYNTAQGASTDISTEIGHTSNYAKRLHKELKDEIGYEGITIGDTPILSTGLYRRIVNQEFLVGTDKEGNDPATGLF